jgi:hypothetical protein
MHALPSLPVQPIEPLVSPTGLGSSTWLKMNRKCGPWSPRIKNIKYIKKILHLTLLLDDMSDLAVAQLR